MSFTYAQAVELEDALSLAMIAEDHAQGSPLGEHGASLAWDLHRRIERALGEGFRLGAEMVEGVPTLAVVATRHTNA